jgi:hypothetical protein
MKMFPVSENYEIRNCNTPLVHPSCDVLASRPGADLPVADLLVDTIALPYRRFYARSCF